MAQCQNNMTGLGTIYLGEGVPLIAVQTQHLQLSMGWYMLNEVNVHSLLQMFGVMGSEIVTFFWKGEAQNSGFTFPLICAV